MKKAGSFWIFVAMLALWAGSLSGCGSSAGKPAGTTSAHAVSGGREHDMPVEGDDSGEEADALNTLETYWGDRVTYPTGRYSPTWLRRAANQAGTMSNGIPAGSQLRHAGVRRHALSTTSFTALGPQPEKMTGCSGCFNYTTTEGRINAIVVDPTTTTNGSIVAYAASDGGGVWKTTNCCSSSTTWHVTTDNPLIADISIDTLTIDPNAHNTIYAGTGDLNYGSFSMGSQGILKSTDGGSTWTVLGANVFGPAYTQPAGQYPQYDSVGKVRVDPNNSSNLAAGTKKGIFLSYDGGTSWSGPCATNTFSSQRQDITGLELSNMGGGVTRILAAVGTRGFATPVQYDLGSNGGNGIYAANMPVTGCPTFSSIASNSNGFVFGTSVSGSPYSTGASMNAGSGSPYVSATSGDQLGRIDIGVAPSNPNVIYAQVGSIASNTASGCGTTAGCQLGAWVTTNGGSSWSFMAGSAGGSLQQCASSGAGSSTSGSGDYPQNWYDQGVAVDPNNPDRVFFDTFEVWLATRTGTHWYDTSCAYSQTTFDHADEHALAFVPGSSSLLLIGNDGGIDGTTNASSAVDNSARPTWFNMDGGLNTIEFYNGDISANFATAASSTIAGGAQDNMDSVATFTGTPTGPAQWQGNVGGDGFYARIDGKGGYVYVSNNNGALHRCTTNCAGTGAVFGGDIRNSTMKSDQQSFVEPFDLFRGNASGTGNAECGTRCNHMMVGTYRVWENTAADTGTTWTARTGDLTKESLGNRSYINNLHYSPSDQTLGMVATNDGNVYMLRGLGGTTTAMNLTGGNTVLPNRPIMDVAFSPSANENSPSNSLTGYASVGGFNANTPSTPGHVFQVVCATTTCASFVWQDKTGNLPDIPVDSIIANPNFPQQVFVGTDFGLYFTNNITKSSPVWQRFTAGLPNVMIWSLSIDRGNTTLSAWTRSRGAYVWPLPTGSFNKLAQSITFNSLPDATYGDAPLTVGATSSSGLTVTFAASGDCSSSGENGSTITITGAGTCTVTASQAGDSDYNAATDASQTFNIDKAGQAIAFGSLSDKTFGDPDFSISATSTAGLDVSLAVTDGNCSLDSSTSPANVHIGGAGTCEITASQAGDSNYDAAADTVRSFDTAMANQTITFDALTDKTYGDPDFQLDASASSGRDVTFAAAAGGQCMVTGSTVHISGAGSCTIIASQAGDGNYNPSADVDQTFAIAKEDQSISFSTLPDHTWGDANFDLTASATSGFDVAFASGATDQCTVTGTSVHITGAGSCTITASQPGDSDYNPASDVVKNFTIDKASQTIQFSSLTNKNYGDSDFTVSATGGGTTNQVVFTTLGGCSATGTNGANIHITGAGSCQVTATQEGDSNYDPAPAVSRTFYVTRAPLSFTVNTNSIYATSPVVNGLAPSDGSVTFSGFVNGDDVYDMLGATANCATTATSSSATGSYPVTGCAGFTNANYAITFDTADSSHIVTGKALTIAASSGETTYGHLVDVTPIYTGLSNGDTHTATQPNCHATSVKGGTHPTTCSGAADPNYTITYVNGALIVDPVPLKVTASDASITYGQPFTIAPSYHGLVFQDKAPAVPPTCGADSANAGTHQTTCSGASDPGYKITYAPGTITVSQDSSDISFTGPPSVKFHKKAKFSFWLRSGVGSHGIPHEAITFALGSQSCKATTDQHGHATCGFKVKAKRGAAEGTITFGGDQNYVGSTDTESIQVI